MRSLKEWRQELRYAKSVWKERGIIGTETPSKMRTLLEFYRSNQWDLFGGTFCGLSNESLIIVNKIFPAANAQQGAIAARNPRMSYFAASREWEGKAPIAESLHNYDIREQRHIKQLNSTFRDAQMAPFAGVRHGYTPPEEIETPETDRKRTS